ncbi:Ppx/GppA family phosphatase [Pseudomonas sp. zfem002]|uniref:Ppx/GppA family phosphatase n=1 Tax=Pseudomonas sp. zfem002 TaxID=3078197 RepID=UPI002929F577|nr:Ppx/GppA family phosphatase [Pseudomonas sp. zfem002]MDU9392270.1 Ppx/GppA family phosphatase [Pseudomonas sp. zfem002]
MKDSAPLFAAVDLGSNAFRMTIAQPVPGNRRPLMRKVKSLREPVRLAEGLHGDALDALAVERGWQALERFGKHLSGFQQGRVRAVATSAVRQARNAALFLEGAEARLGFPIDVISGQEEAALVFSGIAHSMPCDKTTRLVVDIGGGSTELIVGRGKRPVFSESLSIGSGTFGKRYFDGGRVDSRALQQAEHHASLVFAQVDGYIREHGWHAAIGSSGTARMLSRVLKANAFNDGGGDGITYAGLLRLSLALLEAGQVKRLRLDGLQPHRQGMLPGGLAIMLAAFKVFGIDDMTPSEPGLRVGLLHSLMGNGSRH